MSRSTSICLSRGKEEEEEEEEEEAGPASVYAVRLMTAHILKSQTKPQH
jgi:superfamily I DNA/RNA helicase